MTKKKTKIDVYQMLTDKIISKLEQGEIPWKKPWKSVQFGYPKNMISKKIYKGANFFNTLLEDRETPLWVTFKQAQQLGGKVKKGENGTSIVYFQFLDKIDDDGKSYVIPLVKRSTVFNLEQCEGIENPFQEKIDSLNRPSAFNNIESCEELVKSFMDKVPTIENHHDGRAYYMPSADIISMPKKIRFHSEQGYYATLFHEMAHSTGHQDRLARPGIIDRVEKGSQKYAKEELVAELTSAFLCSKAGIENDVIDNNAAYIQNWLGALKNDKMLVYDAMKEAFKAIEYLGILNEAA